jgi:hypothetical protein
MVEFAAAAASKANRYQFRPLKSKRPLNRQDYIDLGDVFRYYL